MYDGAARPECLNCPETQASLLTAITMLSIQLVAPYLPSLWFAVPRQHMQSQA